jgi:hypothetical protein
MSDRPVREQVNSTADDGLAWSGESDVYGSDNKLPKGYVTRGPDLAA